MKQLAIETPALSLQLALNGLILGTFYGLSALGVSFIFGVLRVVNVGHGAFIMLGAYTAFWLFTLYNVNPLEATPAAFVAGATIGMAFFSTVLRRILRGPELATLLATFSLGVLLQEAARLAWSPDTRGYTWIVGYLDLPFISIPFTKIYSALASVAMVAILSIMLTRTRIGTAIRAVAQNPLGASICGVDVEKLYALSFALGLGITVMSGVLLTLHISTGIYPYMGEDYTLLAFVVAVLGSLGSFWGAFFAGIIFGILEQGAYQIFSMAGYADPLSMTKFLAFSMVLLLLLVKPTGILGRR